MCVGVMGLNSSRLSHVHFWIVPSLALCISLVRVGSLSGVTLNFQAPVTCLMPESLNMFAVGIDVSLF